MFERLDTVFSRLKEAGAKLKPSKCDLFKKEVSFLGYVVSQEGVKPDMTKVEAIKNWPIPPNLTDIRSFIGFMSYYRRFIPGFSTRAAPLNKLLEAGLASKWTQEAQTAFDNLKTALTGDEVMAYPQDNGGVYILDTDASNTGIGAVLSEMQWSEKAQKAEERPIAFASKSLSKTQRRYCVTRRELLAVVVFVQQFRHCLLGRKFIVRTDHSALRWVMSFREPNDQMARWLEILSGYDFQVCHRDGKPHRNAYAMSRVTCDPGGCDCYDGRTILQSLPCSGCDVCQKKHQQWSAFMDSDDIVPLAVRRLQ